jgi:hypothetical protein
MPKTKTKKAPGFYVQIIETVERVEKELGPYSSEQLAEKADMGANRNLNHERFFTRTIQR